MTVFEPLCNALGFRVGVGPVAAVRPGSTGGDALDERVGECAKLCEGVVTVGDDEGSAHTVLVLPGG